MTPTQMNPNLAGLPEATTEENYPFHTQLQQLNITEPARRWVIEHRIRPGRINSALEEPVETIRGHGGTWCIGAGLAVLVDPADPTMTVLACMDGHRLRANMIHPEAREDFVRLSKSLVIVTQERGITRAEIAALLRAETERKTNAEGTSWRACGPLRVLMDRNETVLKIEANDGELPVPGGHIRPRQFPRPGRGN